MGNIISSLVAATRRPSPQVHGSGAEAPSSGDEAANSIIKRALLRNLASLCDFFGSDYTNDKVFLWMISFMNERKDWELRKTFFQCISIVSPYLPSMIPTMITFIEDAFADGHEIVVKEALSSLCSLTRLKVAYKYIKSHLIETQRTCGHVSPPFVPPVC